MAVKLRTVYFKCDNVAKALGFWQAFLQIKPHKQSDQWGEFKLENIHLSFLHLDEEEEHQGSNCVPVFEYPDSEIKSVIERACSHGAKIVFDGLDNPHILSVVLKDPNGHEFEISKMHD